MERGELKLIGSKIIQGYFEELIEVLDTRRDSLITKQALYLIVCCCTTCNTNINSCDKLNEVKVISAVKGLSNIISKISTEEYDSYLQSIFFICKLLMKKNYRLLLELEDEILPQFIPKILTDKQKNVYRSICDLIQIEVVDVTIKNIDVDKLKIILMGNLLRKIMIISGNRSIFLDYVFKYGACLQRLNIDLNMQYNYFLQNIAIMKDLPPENIQNGISQLVKFGIHLSLTYLKGQKLENAKQCIDATLNVVPNEGEWGDLKEVLNVCRYIIDPNIDRNNLVTSKDFLLKSFKLYRKSENFISTCKLLSQTMVTYSNYCRNYNEKELFTDPEKQMVLYEILSLMIEILSPPYDSCKKGCKCSSRSNSEGADSALCILILFSLLLTTDVHADYTRKVENFLKKYFKFLVDRKRHKCQMFKKYWADAAPYLHNIGVLLLRKEFYDEAISFGNMTLKYHSLLGEVTDIIVLPRTFNLLNSIYLKQKMYKEALIWSAVEIINTEKSCRNKIFYKWIKIKAASREESDLQEFTILSITNLIPSESTCYISQIKTTEDQIDLLVTELESYHVKWKSKIPMMSAFRQLCQIADKPTSMKVFVRLFTDEDTVVHEEIPKLLNDVFKDFEHDQKNVDVTLKLYWSFFLFFRYKHQTIDLISKNLEEMDRVTKPKKSSDIDIMPADAFDRCDLVSAYENLKVNGEKLKSLIQSVAVLEEIVLSNLDKLSFNDIDPRKVYELTRNIAIEFILHSDGYNTLRSLFLAFNVAQFLGDKVLLLECSGYFLRYLNFSDLEGEMEKTTISIKNSDQSYKCLLQYYMNLSYFHLSVKNIQMAYEHYNSAKKYWGLMTGEDEKNFWCIEVSMELLLFKLMDVARSMKFEMKVEFSYGPLMKAYNVIVNKYTTGLHWTTYSMIILLEIFETLVKMYHDLKMPREVRCFGKQCLTLAQQHVIPVYSSRILSYLAYADLWGEKLDDCRVKLDGIADILLLNKTERCARIPKTKNHLTVPSVNDIMEGIQEIMLDAPTQSSYNVKSLSSSPTQISQPYTSPFFKNHTVCECFHCTSVGCQLVVLSHFHLEALWHMHKGQITVADSFFKGVFKLHESLLDKRKEISDIFYRHVSRYSEYFRNLSKVEYETMTSFKEIKIYTSISYVKFLSSSGAREAAKKFCENALRKFKMAKVHHPHLYGEMLLQKLGLICKFEDTESINIAQVGYSATNNEGDVTDVKVKTPEGNTRNNVVPKINSPRLKKFLPPKIIKFNLTDSNSTPSKTTYDDIASARTPKTRVLPPSLRNLNTPKFKTPARKKMFNEDSKISTPSVNRQNTSSELDTKQKSPLSDISVSSTINSKQPATNLEEKTKLLTSRLRKKQFAENNSIDKSKATKETDIQPVRRSRRNLT